MDPRWVSQLRDCRLTEDDYYLPEPDPRQGLTGFSLETTKDGLAERWGVALGGGGGGGGSSGSNRRQAISVSAASGPPGTVGRQPDFLGAAASLIGAEHAAAAFCAF